MMAGREGMEAGLGGQLVTCIQSQEIEGKQEVEPGCEHTRSALAMQGRHPQGSTTFPNSAPSCDPVFQDTSQQGRVSFKLELSLVRPDLFPPYCVFLGSICTVS